MTDVTPVHLYDHETASTEGLQRATAPAAQPEHILQFFEHAHLPPQLAEVSLPFCKLAQEIVDRLPRNPERTVALRKLLEAKDAAVRALIAKATSSQ